ncbi:ABC transporter, ATP-binding protein [Apilactobacillus ozensis DSM 23829 = JCM 17196]|uniref:ABC transporter, ATP-binding protein n=1 Tax=Apilactobacillus ozensis DSM 23829 = JCM 17196 TaxID=1423781 RepID=A0A0R2B3Y5_9LACO|nr:ABC transporter ATP-binding protein [Apilactobacillus ozensis]KRM69756.1 ABC transporter, ATP-binding protein [Apilactobacillus ozensis DSM 23829 = JCM 17196]
MNTLEIKNLTKFYGRTKALHNVSFDIKPGSILGLIGPNGAGKSTIMKSIVGLTNYSSGSILVNNEKLKKGSRKGLKNVGSMIETPALYGHMTGIQNLKLFNNGSTSDAEIKQIMDETQISSFANRKAKNYSLGMRQRLGIAMALLNHPKLLILDEPMNGLDPQSTHDLRDLLLKLSKRGISILISSHLLDELARIADYYVVINHGKVVKQSDAQSFLSSDNAIIKLNTSDNAAGLKAIQSIGLDAHIVDRTIEVKDKGTALNDSLKALVNAQININNVQRQQEDLEESLLNILTKDKGDK